MPFEIRHIRIIPQGFRVEFTKPVDPESGGDPDHYRVTTFTHPYPGWLRRAGNRPNRSAVTAVKLGEDRRTAEISLATLTRGHVHEFDLEGLLSADGEPLLHTFAFYTVNEVPQE